MIDKVNIFTHLNEDVSKKNKTKKKKVKNEQPKLCGDCPVVPFIKKSQVITRRFVHELI